jgi:hypothetical protein
MPGESPAALPTEIARDVGQDDSLPDLEALLNRARARRSRFIQIRDDAQQEIDNADAYLARLEGKPLTRSTRAAIAEDTYKAVLETLTRHQYAGVSTLANGVSRTHAGACMSQAVERGHATVERVGRKKRWRITDEGRAYARVEHQRVVVNNG